MNFLFSRAEHFILEHLPLPEQSVQVLQADERHNDGEGPRGLPRTSNYQIISKVYLKKHSILPLCYSLSAADKKIW